MSALQSFPLDVVRQNASIRLVGDDELPINWLRRQHGRQVARIESLARVWTAAKIVAVVGSGAFSLVSLAVAALRLAGVPIA
ncbi:MAG: hypothetical protein LBV30_00635 [Propionibacteriaceae bacterium]|jgi:hypothetical protein|nr:hypothetical protein [Propionibacteriaceae bacterium]